MKVYKYKINEDIVLLDRLFLTDDLVYVQSYDPVNGRPQKVFMPDRTFIGSISSDKYWSLVKIMTEESKL